MMTVTLDPHDTLYRMNDGRSLAARTSHTVINSSKQIRTFYVPFLM